MTDKELLVQIGVSIDAVKFQLGEVIKMESLNKNQAAWLFLHLRKATCCAQELSNHLRGVTTPPPGE